MKLFVFLAVSAFCLLGNEVRSSETSTEQSSASDDELSDYPQMRQNAYIIADLEDRIQKLKVKLESLSSTPSVRKIYDDITIRVKRLEGSGCNENEFQCGGNMRQCVSEMLACDGIKDCKNGKDEDPAFCDTSAMRPTNAYTTRLPMEGCIGGGRSSYFFRVDTLTVHRSKIYPPRLKFTDDIHGYVGDKLVMHFVMNGEFQSGTRRSITYTPEWLGLRRDCVYPEDNFDQKLCDGFKGEEIFPCVRNFVLLPAKPYS